jgi:hypothetical protein
MFNVEEIKESITVGKGKSMVTTKVGSLQWRIIQFDGSGLDINLHEVNFITGLWINFLSSNKALKNGYHLCNKAYQFACQRDQFWLLLIE